MEMQGQPAPQMAPGQDEGAQEGGGEQAQAIIKGISQGIAKVGEMIPQLGGSEEDVAAMDKVNQAYQAVMTKVLGGGEEAGANEQTPAQGQSSAMGGPKGVPVGQ